MPHRLAIALWQYIAQLGLNPYVLWRRIFYDFPRYFIIFSLFLFYPLMIKLEQYLEKCKYDFKKSFYSRNYIRSKARKIWRSWKLKAKFWSGVFLTEILRRSEMSSWERACVLIWSSYSTFKRRARIKNLAFIFTIFRFFSPCFLCNSYCKKTS